jgi:hypothetical protein
MRRLLVPASVLGVAWLVVFLRSTPAAYPFGDVAVIELSTLQALRGFVTLGPYSQFGWHHPGPLSFYLLAPFYQLAGHRSIGMAAGALAINLSALAAIGWAAARHAGRLVAAILVAAIGVYLFRADDLAASSWNPHLVIVPLIALTVLCAASSVGDGAAFVIAAAFACFVAETSVSTVPYAAVLLAVAVAGLMAPEPQPRGRRTHWFWIGAASAIAVLLWLPPIVEQLTHQPGNLTRLWRFFIVDHHGGQSWTTALRTWADLTTAVVRPSLDMQWGQTYAIRESWAVGALAILQIGLLGAAAPVAHRNGHRFLGCLCVITMVGSLVACWSVTRIVDDIGGYQVFWMTAVGALGWALVAAVAIVLLDDRVPALKRWGIALFATIAVASFGAAAARGLVHARDYAVDQQRSDATRKVVAQATERYLDRDQVRRPLFRVSDETWLQSAGVILDVYKSRRHIAVEQRWVLMFGEALAPNGREDVELQFVTTCAPGDRMVAEHDGLCVRLLHPTP